MITSSSNLETIFLPKNYSIKNYSFLHFFLRRRFRFYYLYLLDVHNKSTNNTNYSDIYSNLF